jgi:hypothetical protein
VIRRVPRRLTLPGISFAELQKLTAAELIDARDSREAQCDEL